ncbi:MmyB family transcriptional regulator [Nocardia paucivorans]|uniref:MmyB family transcriptional regulator n=1 Tax=Nocardia paucivorans TaxID=114259 RepID=UPI000312C2D4|nr:hypothetical protein [Nocardia paucivorans]
MFLDDSARSLFVDREVQARAAVESLRLDVGRDPDDRAGTQLVSELREQSPAFDRWWEQHRVHQRTHESKRLRHPLVGEPTVEFETLALPGDADTTLFFYTAEAGSASRRALDLLASWTLTGSNMAAVQENSSETERERQRPSMCRHTEIDCFPMNSSDELGFRCAY